VRSESPAWVLDHRQQVGRRIRRLRTERGVSQELLAERAGLARHTIYRTELGTTPATLDALLLIAHALGVPPDHLLRDAENG
jgi:transcriptional regulator with XRE-family HTH domain